MYAVIRQNRYRSRQPEDRSELARVEDLHLRQPGYLGSLVVDDGECLTAVNLWESEEAAEAGRIAIGPEVRRLLEPLMIGPAELIAAGNVTESRRDPNRKR
jgi:hypothetical protein